MRKKIEFFIICVLISFSCSENMPKPAGFPRVDRSNSRIDTFSCYAFTFHYPASVKIEEVKKESTLGLWFNMNYIEYDATIYCTYIPVNRVNIAHFLDESYQSAYGHVLKADGVLQTQYEDSLHHTAGILYDIKGSVASPIQFYITDSVSNFFRGSLYFNHTVKPDSVAPIVQYIREDIVGIIETLKWVR